MLSQVIKRSLREFLRSSKRALSPYKKIFKDELRRSRLPNPIDAAVVYPYSDIIRSTRLERRHYEWGSLAGAHLGSRLNYPAISLVEFGVAGGNGLLELERVAEKIEKILSIRVEVHGFDSGKGLPKPVDHRDLPQRWTEGEYQMDVKKLKSRLKRACLHLGPVCDTVPRFLAKNPAPVAFAAFDLDYYSSTMDAFSLFRGSSACLVPRVYCYFDDIMGGSFGDCNGERLAITDFNRAWQDGQISKIYGLPYFEIGEKSMWHEMMYMFHSFNHPQYREPVEIKRSQLPLQ